MRKQERPDEIFVKNAILKYTGLPYAVRGNDPPDYWIGEGANRIALEVTIAPRLGGRTTAESTMMRLCNKLNNELGNRIQSGYSMLIKIHIPIRNLGQFKKKLRDIIITQIEQNVLYDDDKIFEINGEVIKTTFVRHRGKSILGIISGKDLPLVPLNSQFDKMINDWEGRNINDLIAELGPPNQLLDDGQGGKILIYTSTKNIHSYGDSFTTYQGSGQTYYTSGSTAYSTGSGTANTFTTPGHSYSRSRHQMFWVNDNGIIYRIEYQKTKGR